MIRFFIIVFILSCGCAQVRPLTGGDKDTIPPNIIFSLPNEFSTNVNSKNFYFEFDEIIDASMLEDKMIISPYYSGGFETVVKKNTLKILFDSVFNKNTTYILNFADGIKDITEKNPSIYSKYIFSTGNKIDSSSVSGRVQDPINNVYLENILVGLYSADDSLGLFTKKPIYFSQTDDLGFFEINNVKEGNYVLYAFNDENKNFKADYKSESFGFKEDLLNVNGNLERVYIPLFKEDVTDFKVLRTRKRGDFFEIIFNKDISDYYIENKDVFFSLYDNTTLRFYNKSLTSDSVLIKYSVFDLYSNNVKDSVFVGFGENEVNYELRSSFSFSDSNFDDTIYFSFNSNIPLIDYEINNYYIKLDTLFLPNKHLNHFTYKKNNNEIEGYFYLNKDSIENYITYIKNNLIEDSVNVKDSIRFGLLDYLENLQLNKIVIGFKEGDLITIKGDTISDFKKDLVYNEDDFYGDLSGVVNLDKDDFYVELVNENFTKIYKNKRSGNFFLFNKIKPGKYFLRVVIDNNSNNKWDYYSIKTKKSSESIFYYSDVVEIFSNWSIEDFVFDVNQSVDRMFIKSKEVNKK